MSHSTKSHCWIELSFCSSLASLVTDFLHHDRRSVDASFVPFPFRVGILKVRKWLSFQGERKRRISKFFLNSEMNEISNILKWIVFILKSGISFSVSGCKGYLNAIGLIIQLKLKSSLFWNATKMNLLSSQRLKNPLPSILGETEKWHNSISFALFSFSFLIAVKDCATFQFN